MIIELGFASEETKGAVGSFFETNGAGLGIPCLNGTDGVAPDQPCVNQ